MRISQRVRNVEESATIAVSNKAAQMRAAGIDVVSFGAGEPDFATPEHIVEAAFAAIRRGETKYAKPSSGIPEVKKAICGKFQRENGLSYEPSQVIVTVGGKEALWLAFATILDPGDEVIIPAPYWVTYPEQVKLSDGVPVIVQTDVSTGFKMTPFQLKAALTPKTRAVVFNSPSNPTGATYTPDEVRALAAVVEGREIIVISDEMYDRLLFGGRTYLSWGATSDHAFRHTITFNAGSKAYSMTGWRIGYAAGPLPIIKEMIKLQSQTTSGAATFTMHALAAALDGDQQCVEEMRVEFERRGRFLAGRLNTIPGVVCPEPGGAFYVFPDISGTYERVGVTDSFAWASKLLDEAHVAVVPGAAFGGEGCVRLSYATGMATIEKGVERIERFLR